MDLHLVSKIMASNFLYYTALANIQNLTSKNNNITSLLSKIRELVQNGTNKKCTVRALSSNQNIQCDVKNLSKKLREIAAQYDTEGNQNKKKQKIKCNKI